MRYLRLSCVGMLLLAVSACTPKAGTLRSPSYKGDVGTGTSTTKPTGSGQKTGTGGDAKTEESSAASKRFSGTNIALLLPFQLDQIAVSTIGEKDIRRSALALDFYQGFQLGLESLTKNGKNYQLQVLDTRDNDFQNLTIAKSETIKEASIVVGPVYPKEIKSFGEGLVDKAVLQINPLAASMPSEFNLPNLVSLTPPIKAHSNAIAVEVAREFSLGDVIIIYNSNDNDGRQFLSGMMGAIKQNRSATNVVSVSSIAQLNENLSNTGFSHIVVGTTDKLQLKTLINNLVNKTKENVYNIQLYGHPLWARYDWEAYPDFANFSPRITSESILKGWSSAVKDFKTEYNAKYSVQPSDHSYKGYDCAIYFGQLLNKYGFAKLKENLVNEPYDGLFSRYKFKYNDVWGYANEAVSIRIYRNGDFQLR